MNLWNIFAAVWYLAVEFKQEGEITKDVAEYYPYVCTCQEETDTFAKLLKATAATLTVMSGCTPAEQKAAVGKS
jgi:hypothetical protein